jgi:hypothetical protein
MASFIAVYCCYIVQIFRLDANMIEWMKYVWHIHCFYQKISLYLDELVYFNFHCFRFSYKPDCSHLWDHKVSPNCPFEAHVRTFRAPKQPSLVEWPWSKPCNIPTATTTTTAATCPIMNQEQKWNLKSEQKIIFTMFFFEYSVFILCVTCYFYSTFMYGSEIL